MRTAPPSVPRLITPVGFLLAVLLWHASLQPANLFAAGELAEAPQPRLALCGSGDEMAGGIVALLEVELSGRDDLVLLDREHVARVLAEHELFLKGLLSMDDALAVGRLLKCDVLAELHYEEATPEHAEVTSLVAIDTLTGVRLYDGALPPHEALDERAGAAAKALAIGLAKWQGGGTVPDCRTLSFVSIRQLDLPEALRHVPKTLGLLLQRRLVNSPDVALLERQRIRLINEEAELTALRRDRLMASSVLVDLDLATGNGEGKLVLRATLTDGAGKPLGTADAAGSAEDLDGLVTGLAEKIVEKLKLTPPSELATVQGFEADRFLADAMRLELRGRKEEAAVSETAATALAEAALLRTPLDPRVQKVICRLLRRQAQRSGNAWQTVALLERYLDLAARWPHAADTRWFTDGLAELLHGTVKRLGGDGGAERVVTLRRRFGEWCREMAAQDPACVGNLRCVEAWSTSPGELLEGSEQYLETLPDGFGVGRYSGTAEYSPVGPADYLFPIEKFSPAEKQKLLSLYERWAEPKRPLRMSPPAAPQPAPEGESASARLDLFRRMQSCLCAAMLVNDFPDAFPGSDELVEQFMRRAAQLVVADPTLTGRLLKLCEDRAPRPPSFYRPLPRELITEEVRRLADLLDLDRVACPLLLEYLDEHDADNADHPGAYLEKAWTQLDSPDFLPPRGDVLVPRFAEWYVERLGETYHARYGREILASDPAEIEAADLESIARLFEFEGVPGVSSIESAELAGDWLYLLCLHTNPRSYELRRVNVFSQEQEVLGEVVTDAEYRARTGNEIYVAEQAVYVPTSQGLLCFSPDTTATWTIAEQDGLPAPRVTACLEAEGKLYLGCRGREEGYLVACDLDGRNVSVLASSGRKEKHSGLDDCPPYTVDSMIYDGPRRRIFFAAMFLEPEASDRPWLWAVDIESGELREVHRQPYHPLQLRMLPGGRCLFHLADMHTEGRAARTLLDGSRVTVAIRIPSAQAARGYGFWDPATYTGTPLADLQEHLVPLIGTTDPERLRIRYEVPTFCGRSHTMPGTTSSLALLGEKHLVSSAVRRTPLALDAPAERFMKTAQAGSAEPWQLIARSDVSGTARSLPALDGEGPFTVRIHGDAIVACTQAGAWLLEPRFPPSRATVAVAARCGPDEPGNRAATGKLVVEAPLGSCVRVDDAPPLRVWNGGQLGWGRIPAGEHVLRVEFLGRTVERHVVIEPEKTSEIAASFGKTEARKRTLQLGSGCAMELVWVPKRAEEQERSAWTLPEGIWLGKYEVTQEQFQAVMGRNPSAYLAPGNPVENVGRRDAEEFCRRLTERWAAELGGWIVRLPSEDEWVYACKAWTTTKHYSGDTTEDFFREGWFPENGGGRPHAVGRKTPNAFWLHDMPGNVAEWCERGNPHGGSWRSYGGTPSGAVGFRVVLSTAEATRQGDSDGWVHLAYVDPVHARVGYGSFIRFKRRDKTPPMAGATDKRFETALAAHAVSSIQYKLDGKYEEFSTCYGRRIHAAGVARFAVFCDGQQRFRSSRIWSHGGTQATGLREPVRIDLTGVDLLELKTYGDDNGSISGSMGIWCDPKIR